MQPLQDEEKELREEIEKALKEAQCKDKEEDKLYGEKESGRSLPEGLGETTERLNRIEKAIGRLKDSRHVVPEADGEKVGGD